MKKCENCYFFEPSHEDEGLCHGTTPTVFFVPAQSKIGGLKPLFFTKFPDVRKHFQACSLYKESANVSVSK